MKHNQSFTVHRQVYNGHDKICDNPSVETCNSLLSQILKINLEKFLHSVCFLLDVGGVM